jgi:hypothetical protein
MASVCAGHTEEDTAELVTAILAWGTSDSEWQARSAMVSMVNFASRKEPLYSGFREQLIAAAEITVQRQERFIQLGTGSSPRLLFENIFMRSESQLSGSQV